MCSMINPPKSKTACIKTQSQIFLPLSIVTVNIPPIKNVYKHCNKTLLISLLTGGSKLVRWNKENIKEQINVVSSGLCFLFFNRSSTINNITPLKTSSSSKAIPTTNNVYKPNRFMLIEAVIIFVIMFVLQKISNFVFKSNSLGFGDVKLMAVLALILGYKMALVCLFISCFMALPIAIYNLQKNDKKLLPFGPYLAFGTIIIMLFNINFDMIIEFIKK